MHTCVCMLCWKWGTLSLYRDIVDIDKSILGTSNILLYFLQITVYQAFVGTHSEIFQDAQRSRLLSPALLWSIHFPLPSASNRNLSLKSLCPTIKLIIPPPPWDSPPVAPDWLFLSLNVPFMLYQRLNSFTMWKYIEWLNYLFPNNLLCNCSFDKTPWCLAIYSAHVAAPKEPLADGGQWTKHPF